ncbi:GNAT family N-acetyltransferase [Paenibacillus oenotherae]|uniref:GNAT family N-acetyltransferase n=1 Tax=Paenibacillus oenotherae TaxID=1435645 RepID=A0ABS7DCH1_9BACL|nr:GNAT family N-acetyltransferase [Paenibacillus oenotherae]MBW7477632.1 GNAT family N-acetyltransferase [Paenibacillus oenotherae]
MIRLSRPDEGQYVVPLLYAAIGSDIAAMLTGEREAQRAMEVMLDFFGQQGNRLSYENVVVAEADGHPVGCVLFYHGSAIGDLDRPLLNRVAMLTNNPDVSFTREAQEDEFYLDSLAVDDRYQGRGIGGALIAAFEAAGRARGFDRLALIVIRGNDKAKALYIKKGYEPDGQLELCGHIYDHMVKRIDHSGGSVKGS